MRRPAAALALWLLSTAAFCLWGQSTADNATDNSTINFGAKGGFTSTLLWVSELVVEDVEITQIQNNYQIGYFGSFFMRINFRRHFLQPEISYTVNRSSITFQKAEATGSSSISSDIRSFDLPIIYGYNFIKEGPYSLAVFGGPKVHYIMDKYSHEEFKNVLDDSPAVDEVLSPINLSFTLGVAVAISPLFFDFRYDVGLHNISRRITYLAANEAEVPADRLRFSRRNHVLSFSVGLFF
jgi:hypothetical protein